MDSSPRPRSSTRKALIAIVVLLALVAGSFAAFALWVRHSIGSQIQHIEIDRPAVVEEAKPQSTPPGPAPLNFLILGSDSRESGGDPTNWRAGAQRSDVMLVAQLSPDRKALSLMSLPRDSWVDIPGHGTAKINAAFSFGGPELAIATVENLLGIHIDHFMVMDFTGFAELTDQFGGVTIETAAGQQTLNGEQALAFVRERKGLPAGDFDRQRRHQAWIKAVMAEMFKGEVLSNPSAMQQMMTTVLSHSFVDSELTVDKLISLGLEARNLRPSNVDFFTAPYTGTGTSADGQSIVLLNDAELPALREAWAKGTLSTYIRNNGNIVSLDEGYVN